MALAPELAAKPLEFGLSGRRTSSLDVARGTAALASHHLLFGVGPGGFRDAYFEHRPEREARTPTRGGYASDVDHPHCEPLRQLAEGGVPVLLAFALALLATGRALLAARGAAREDDGWLRAGLIGAVRGCSGHALGDRAPLLLGALLVGLALAGEGFPIRWCRRGCACRDGARRRRVSPSRGRRCAERVEWAAALTASSTAPTSRRSPAPRRPTRSASTATTPSPAGARRGAWRRTAGRVPRPRAVASGGRSPSCRTTPRAFAAEARMRAGDSAARAASSCASTGSSRGAARSRRRSPA
jgi:hypothetical protein